MTAKTAKGRDAPAKENEGTEESEGTEETEGTEDVLAEPARPKVAAPERAAAKKKVRRVRVIEVIDDEDLDDEDLGDVLHAMDAGEDDEEEPSAKPTRSSTSTRTSRGKPSRKAEAATDEAVPGEDIRDEADDDPAEGQRADDEPEEKAGRGGFGGLLTVLESRRLTLVLVVVVLAAVASWSTLQWYSVSGQEKQRQKVSAAAARFGDVVYSYDPANVQAAIDHNREMMAGDLLTQYTASADSYKQFFAKNKWTWTSKTGKVYLSDVQDTLASAVIVIDINIKMTEGPYSVSGAHFTLGLVKQKGAWKVSSMKAAGSEAATDGQQGSKGGLPGLSGGTGGDAKDTKKKN